MFERELFEEYAKPPVTATVATAKPAVFPKAALPPSDDGDYNDDFELIIDLIGEAAAFKLAEAFAGSNIYIPKNILKNRDYLEIRKKYRKGSDYRELSLEYGYTETHIRNIIHRGREIK